MLIEFSTYACYTFRMEKASLYNLAVVNKMEKNLMAKPKPSNKSENTAKIGKQLPLGALLAEMVGTFILTYAVLMTGGNAILAAFTFIILVLMLSKLSGGHMNPIITVGLLLSKRIHWTKALGFVLVQFLGAMLAVVIANRFIAGTEATDIYQQSQLYTVTVTGEWKPFFGELIGSLVFGFGVAAAIFGKKDGFDAAFTIGGSLMLGLVIATSGSSAILNPAVALGVGALDLKNIWGPLAYALAPVIGGVAGMMLYNLLQLDIDLLKTKSTK